MKDMSIDASQLEAAVGRLGASGLAGLRSAALARFLKTGLPTTADEDWKYTSLARVAQSSGEWLATVGHSPGSLPAASSDAPAALTVRIEDGRIDDASIDALNAALGDTGRAYRLSASAERAPGIYMDDAVSSLNAALMPDALCVDIGAHAVVEQPILVDIVGAVSGHASSSQVRLLITLAEGSRAQFVEVTRSASARSTRSADHFASVVTEISMASGADAAYGRIQLCDSGDTLVHRLLAELAEGSRLQHGSVDLGGRLVRNDVAARLSARDACFESSGLFLANGEQHIDNHVLADHQTGPTISRQTYRGIAADKARCVYNGKALVQVGADGTDAEQSSHNLLLSDRAEIDTKPELEIYAEDVKCAHGATVGQLDERALFYLQSRGIGRERAKQLLIRAFAAELLANFPVESFREYVASKTEGALARITSAGDAGEAQ